MNIIALFCDIDDFLLAFEKWMKAKELSPADTPKKRHRKHRMHTSEVMAILVYFHQSQYRTFKHYYLRHVCVDLRWAFLHLLSYNRFVKLIPQTLIPFAELCNLFPSIRVTKSKIDEC